MYGIIPTPRSIQRAGNMPVMSNPFELLFAPLADAESMLAQVTDGAFKVDLKETDDAYELKADFPGAEKDEVDAKIENDVLTITYEHKEESGEKEDGKWLTHERSYSSTTRSFRLPDADDANTKAELVDGVLTITVPKKEKEDSATSIEIS